MQPISNRIISQANWDTSRSSAKKFFVDFHISKLLYNSGIRKVKGCSSISIFYMLFMLSFLRINIFQYFSIHKDFAIIKKDSIYNFLNSYNFGWRNLLTSLSKEIIDFYNNINSKKKHKNKDSADLDDNCCLALDDTPCYKNRSKYLEVCAKRLFDHSKNAFFRGYFITVALLTDGISQIVFDFSVSGSSNLKNIESNNEKKLPENSNGARRRAEIRESKLELAGKMVERAHKKGLKIKAVLFDSWYANPSFISHVSEFYNVVCNIKMIGYKYKFNGKYQRVRCIFNTLKNINKNKNVFSGIVTMKSKNKETGEEKEQKVKIVFIRKSDSEEFMAILSTNTRFSNETIIKLYKTRWDIEVFFKTTKQFLNLENGTQSCNLDAIIASITISCIRFNYLSYIERTNKDPLTMGALCSYIYAELSESTYEEALAFLLDTITTAAELFNKGRSSDARRVLSDLKAYIFSVNSRDLESKFTELTAQFEILAA